MLMQSPASAIARSFASSVRSAVMRRASATMPGMVQDSQRAAKSARTSPMSSAPTAPPALLDASEYLALHRERADETVESRRR
jgi:hypothetical protein